MEFTEHQYYISTNKVSWKEAFTLCEKYGGHRVTITSAAENKEIIKALKTKKIRDEIWISFTDEKHEGKWEWVTGEKSDFTYWDYSQPDNWTGNEDFGEIWQVKQPSNTVTPFHWNDFTGYENLKSLFILEME